jgi:ribose transport system substrate-binding protein
MSKVGCAVRRWGLIGSALAALVAVSGLARADDVPAYVREAQKIVESGYKGNFDPPPSTGPAAVRGKKVWYISCGQAYAACSTAANGFA